MWLRVLLIYLAALNLLTYFLFWLDKRRAEKGKWRISEKELLLWSALGGWPAASIRLWN